jgi:hypothetical protein
MAKKQGKDPDEFWREFEEKTGEKVLARSLGQYLSGWDEFDTPRSGAIWGLIITTNGGFRFHHFPQTSWLDALTRFSSGADAPKEKTFFIPNQRIISAELIRETKWWKKIFSPSLPRLIIKYRNEAGEERKLLVQTEYKSEGLAEQLQPSR